MFISLMFLFVYMLYVVGRSYEVISGLLQECGGVEIGFFWESAEAVRATLVRIDAVSQSC